MFGFVDPAGQPDRCTPVGERVDTVDEHGGRPAESSLDGRLVGVDQLVSDGGIETSFGELG